MKMSQYHYDTLKKAMKAVYDSIRLDNPDFDLDRANTRLLYWCAIDDIQYDDTHPRYKKGRRYYPHIAGFMNEYDYKDSHIDTAIFSIQKEFLAEGVEAQPT